jgi:hypothetical protein
VENLENDLGGLLSRRSNIGWRKIIEIAMDAEKTITEIELLERIHALPDTRLFSAADREAGLSCNPKMPTVWFACSPAIM